MEIYKAIMTRRSIRHFTEESVSDQLCRKLLCAFALRTWIGPEGSNRDDDGNFVVGRNFFSDFFKEALHPLTGEFERRRRHSRKELTQNLPENLSL